MKPHPISPAVDLSFYEKESLSQGYLSVIGIDEAGRGPLAGPVVAAAVLFPRHPYGLPVMDSKQLTEKQRERLYEQLVNTPDILYGIGVVSAAEIDRYNILRATHLAMRLAAEKISSADFALVDGLPIKGLPIPHRAIVKGDRLSESIAAASIIAKVWRDHYMMDLDQRFPEYHFAKHKGYGTKDHLFALQKYGPCREHRVSFAPVRAVLPSEEPQQLSLDL